MRLSKALSWRFSCSPRREKGEEEEWGLLAFGLFEKIATQCKNQRQTTNSWHYVTIAACKKKRVHAWVCLCLYYMGPQSPVYPRSRLGARSDLRLFNWILTPFGFKRHHLDSSMMCAVFALSASVEETRNSGQKCERRLSSESRRTAMGLLRCSWLVSFFPSRRRSIWHQR